MLSEAELRKNKEIESFSYADPFATDGAPGIAVAQKLNEMDTKDWYPAWLSRMTGVDPRQPYEYVRQYLLGIGDFDAARAVGIAGRNAERRRVCSTSRWSQCIFLWSSYVTIGCGYSLWLAALWALRFVVLGAYVFRRTSEAKANGMPHGYAYSFDTFLPLIKLREIHYTIDLTSAARYYFYVHKLAGWILGSFIVAALSGLTK